MTLKTGTELKAWRRKRRIKQLAVARVLGVGQRYLSKLENENRPLSTMMQWALEGITRHVEQREVPPAFVCGDYFQGAATRRTSQE